LADFQAHLAEFRELGTAILALSADSRDDALSLVTALGLEFTVGYGLDPEPVASAIGCYTGVREGRPHLQPAAFVLDPDGNVVHAVYSSGKVGRLTARDALILVRDRAKAAGEKSLI